MIILQSRLSGLYFKDFGLWVAHVAEALRFSTLESARSFIAAERVSDVALREAPSILPKEEWQAPSTDGSSQR